MKICFVCNEYPPAPHYGLGVVYQNLAENLVRLGIDVWVTGYGRKMAQPFEQNGVKVSWLSLPSPISRSIQVNGYSYSLATFLKRPYLSLHLRKLTNTQRFDLVESSDFNGPLYSKPFAKFIVRLEGSVTAYRYAENRPDFNHPVDKYFERKQLLMADHIIACSRYIAELTNLAFGLDLSNKLLYNAVDTELFYPQPKVTDPGQILYVGNIMWRKGVFDLIRAMPAVIAEVPGAHLTIAGGAGGVHLQQLEAELSALPGAVRQKVDIIGHIAHEDLPKIYNKVAVVVFPSRVEAFGLTCVEAMSCGRPVVATCLASGPELVEDGISGLLADPSNPADLAEKINLLLDDPELAQKLGINARQRVLEKFDLRDLGPRNLAFYQSVLQGAV
jgi:glycosyltransferase involved in cell wall biosynthesis